MDMFSHAEQHRRHVERQKRLWARPSTKETTNRVLEAPCVKEGPRKLNMWEIFEMEFDAHVHDWQTMIRKSYDLAAENHRLKSELGMKDDQLLNDDEEFFFHRKQPIREIIAACVAEYGVSWEKMKGKSRERKRVNAKHKTIHALHEARPDLSLPAIGRIFEMDHTSILFAIRKIKALNGDEKAREFVEKKTANMKIWFEEMKEGRRTKGKTK